MMWKIKYQCHISHWSPSHHLIHQQLYWQHSGQIWTVKHRSAGQSLDTRVWASASLLHLYIPLFYWTPCTYRPWELHPQLFIILASHNPTLVHTNYENCISHSLLKTLHLFHFLPLRRHHVREYSTVSRTIIWLFIIKLYCHSIIITVSCLDPECNWFLIQELNFYHLG